MRRIISVFVSVVLIISAYMCTFLFVPVAAGAFKGSGAISAPDAPADISGARYYYKKTYSSLPGGTETVNGVTYTTTCSGVNTFNSYYGAPELTAYLHTEFKNPLNDDTEYCFSADFMASDVNFGSGVIFSVYLMSGYKLASFENGGKLYLCQQDTKKALSPGVWYRLSAVVTPDNGNVSAQFTDILTGEVVASKSATGKITSVTQLRVAPNIVATKPLYIQNWQLYRLRNEDGEDQSTVSGSICFYPKEIKGPLFAVAPYKGEAQLNEFKYTAFDFDGDEASGVSWSLKGAPNGVSISQSGVLSVRSGTESGRVKIIATLGGVSAEKTINIVSRYEGAPNLLRLSGANVSITSAGSVANAYDGKFDTSSVNEQSEGYKYIDIKLPEKYDIDVFRIYKDFGGAYASAQVNCRVGSVAFGGKGWINAPLESEVWNPAPAINSDVLRYGMNPVYHRIDVYEAELYSSYMRFSFIDMPSDTIAIPTKGENSMKLTARAENGSEISTVTYADGEVHPLKWKLHSEKPGISINESSGVITVSSSAEPAVVTATATYFGREISRSIKIGSGNKAQMDYDWLLFEKLTDESPDNITYKMTLPCEGICGSVILWESSEPDYISVNGDVNPPLFKGDKKVTLTATISNGNTKLKKTFEVTVKQPSAFEDITSLSDIELFGLWDEGFGKWAIEGKLNYDSGSEFGAVENAVRNMNYNEAKQILYNITKNKLKNPIYSPSVSKAYANPIQRAYANNVTTYGLGMIEPITIGNELKWYTHNVKDILTSGLEFNIIFQSEFKEYAEVEIDSKESDFAPYIMVTLKNGSQKRFDVKKDTTLRAGFYSSVNYGAESVMRVKDETGYPVDSNTKRACMNFELSGIKASEVSAAVLYVHGHNTSKTGNKRLYVAYNVSGWDENTECWNSAKVSDSFYSYGENGFSYDFSPGGDAEVTYQQNGGRLRYVSDIASGFKLTGNEDYACKAFKLIDRYFKRAGECTSYPRGLDSTSRNQNILTTFKLCADSGYFTPETATILWKHIWNQQSEMSTGREPFWHGNTGNIAISLSEHMIKTSVEFPEFSDVSKWTEFYLDVMQPVMETSILEDGSYVEAADGYATSSIKTFAASVLEAKESGIQFGEDYDKRIHLSAYNYAAQKAPGFSNIRFGDSWTGGGNSETDSFLVSMAELFEDDELMYIATSGKSGSKPDNASLYFPVTKRAFLRSEWSRDASYLMINADDGYGGHAHEDDLSLIAYAYGDFVIPDTSVLSYATDNVSVEMKKSYQHNTLGRITDMSSGNVSVQQSSKDLSSTKVVNYVSDNMFDYISVNANPDLYSGRNTSYNRKILFVKPGYWIVSDYVKDNNPGSKTKNKYDIMFHLRPDSVPVINGTTVSTDSDSANVCLVCPDEAFLTLEDAYYTDKVGSYVMTNRAVYSKTEIAEKPVTFNTVVYPSETEDKNVSVNATSLDTGVSPDTASAMHISRSDKNGEFDDYFYYSNEKNFNPDAQLGIRNFGDFSFDGELAYQSYAKDGTLKSALIVSGSKLLKNGKAVIATQNTAQMLDICVENSVVTVNCSNNIEELGQITIDANCDVSKVMHNNKSIDFSVTSDGKIVIPADFKVITNGNEVTVSYNMKQNENVIIAIAVYSDNKMVNVDFKEYKNFTGEVKSVTNVKSGCTVKAFLWKGDNLSPLYKAIDVN